VTAATIERTGRRPWLLPLGVALAGGAALGYVALRDPSTQRGFLPCPFHEATGLWCPGCGMTRAVHALSHGDIGTALGFNLFVPVVVAVATYAWLAWFLPAVGGPALPKPATVPKAAWIVLGALVLVFAVARNLPVEPLRALAP
jgi:hypothetical protein